MRCGLCALLLSIVVRGQVEYFPIFNENVTKCDNAITEEMTSKPWLISEHVPGGFCNQLFGVFSTAPIAKLIGANLILGPLFSRRSFQTSYEDFTDNMVKLPYSAFFDVKHMRNFWHSRGVEIVQKMDVKACMNVNSIVTIWKPRFFSYSDAEIMQVIETNWTLPFPPGAGVLFTNEHSMTAFYDHLQSGRNLIIKGDEDVEDIPNKHLLQLGDMYNSLLPNTKIK